MDKLNRAREDLAAMVLHPDGNTSQLPESVASLLIDPNSEEAPEGSELVHTIEIAGRRAVLTADGENRRVLITDQGQDWWITL